MTAPVVRVGQVWADNDKRSAGRHVRVLELLPPEPARPHVRAKPARALVARCDPAGQTIRLDGKDARTRIAVSRFRPTSTGYRLVIDVPPAP